MLRERAALGFVQAALDVRGQEAGVVPVGGLLRADHPVS
jgi:hypothetical protein